MSFHDYGRVKLSFASATAVLSNLEHKVVPLVQQHGKLESKKLNRCWPFNIQYFPLIDGADADECLTHR